MLLGTSCGILPTRTVYVPTPPCVISPFPPTPVLTPFPCEPAVCYSVEDQDKLTTFIFQVRRWRSEVKSCNGIKEYKRRLAVNYESTIYSIMKSF